VPCSTSGDGDVDIDDRLALRQCERSDAPCRAPEQVLLGERKAVESLAKRVGQQHEGLSGVEVAQAHGVLTHGGLASLRDILDEGRSDLDDLGIERAAAGRVQSVRARDL